MTGKAKNSTSGTQSEWTWEFGHQDRDCTNKLVETRTVRLSASPRHALFVNQPLQVLISPPMFARSSVCVKGGTFFDVQGGYHVHGQKRSGFDFLFESVAQGAFHNSAERFDPPKCHPSTRIVILQKIMDWIKDLDPSSPDIMWLYGPVGAGKSAIAQSIAELCFELGLLIGTFFFSRSIPGRNDDKRLVATIAYHIAISFPEAKPYIEKAIEEDPSLLSRSLETQLKAIIVEPFSKISTNLSSRPETRPRLIVIDGLDECQESRAQSSIIHLFSQLILHHKLPFAILFGSRAEYHIRAAFQDDQFKDSLLSIPLDDTYCPDADIREFLSIRFREIRDNHPLKHCIPDPWPSIEAIEELVQKSSGQFIYASTVIKYVDSHRHRPTDRLNVILGLKSVEDEAPFTELDNLYKHILSSVQDFGLTSRVLGLLLYVELPFPIIGLFKIITSPHFMEEFLSLQKGDVYLALSDLHSVLHAPSDDDYDFGIHASFTDFLADRYRSGRYFLDPVRVQEDLAICCIQHFNAARGDDIYKYSAYALAMHCSKTRLSPILSGKLFLFDLTSWMKYILKPDDEHLLSYRDFWEFFPVYISWITSQIEPEANDLLNHSIAICDRYLLSELDKYAAKKCIMNIFCFIILEGTLSLMRCVDMVHYKYGGLKDLLEIDNESLHITKLHRGHLSYLNLLRQFFSDDTRARKYAITGDIYAMITHSALEYLLGREQPKNNNSLDYRTCKVGIPRIPMLLSRSDPSKELFWYLDGVISDFNNDFDPLPTPLHTQEAKDALSDYLKRSRDVLFGFRPLFQDLGSLPGLIMRRYFQ